MRKPEIMSPAGHWPQLRAAIEAGADSVYFGLTHFSARAKVGFSLADLPEVMRTLHSRGVRGYLTFNTLVFEHELPEAASTIAAIARSGVDALIVQDVGALSLARRIAPPLELHASTQMSITDSAGVRFAQSLGAQRVTLARELSLAETRRIFDETGCSLEIFVHGALCVAYSGQCFSSEAWGGRSANRGQCAQACRMPYEIAVDGEIRHLADARYLLSPGDLYTLRQMPEIIASGVQALKIEGRYKDAEYVALVTAAYRKALDEAWAGRELSITPSEEMLIEQIYSRGLAPSFVTGTNHQAVVRGRAPRHRGVLVGKVLTVAPESVVVHTQHEIEPGDGIVFDAADWRSPDEPEEGGRIYEVVNRRGSRAELRFANRAVNFSRIRPGDLVWRTSSPQTAKAARPWIEAATPVHRRKIDVAVEARTGHPLAATWTVGATSVTVGSSAPLETATGRSIDDQSLRDQFSRLGNTAFELGQLTLTAKGTPFVPVSLLNQLRREAIAQIEAKERTVPAPKVNDSARELEALRPRPRPVLVSQPKLHLLVRTPEQLEAAITIRPATITLDYLDLYGLRPSIEKVRAAGLTARVASPRILKPGEAKIVDFLAASADEILVRGSGMLHTLISRTHPPLTADFSLNAANSIAVAVYLASGLQRLTPTHDLNSSQIAALARDTDASRLEVIAYQHLPVFHTEHCVFCRFLSTGTSYRDCGRPCEKHRVELQDKSGRRHPVVADVGCRNTVFGAEAQEASASLGLWLESGIRHFRLEFAHETAAEVTEISSLFRSALEGEIPAERLTRELRRVAPQGTTRGSLYVPPDYLTLPILQ